MDKKIIQIALCIGLIIAVVAVFMTTCVREREPVAEPAVEDGQGPSEYLDAQRPIAVIPSATPEPTKSPAQAEPESRYNIRYTQEELDELAAIVYLEAGNQCPEGQQAVAEVVLNRVASEDFPDTITEVLHQGEDGGPLQFTTIKALHKAAPTEEQYRAIHNALYGEPILPMEVVYFSRHGENSNVWGSIGDHVFCYGYGG